MFMSYESNNVYVAMLIFLLKKRKKSFLLVFFSCAFVASIFSEVRAQKIVIAAFAFQIKHSLPKTYFIRIMLWLDCAFYT